MTTRVRIEIEIRALEAQLARHVGDLGDIRPGRGYVAAEIKPVTRAKIDEEIERLRKAGTLKESEISTLRRLREAVGADIPGERELRSIEADNRVDFVFHEDDKFLALIEKKGRKHWMSQEGNAPSTQLGETLIAYRARTIDSVALPEYLLANQWSPGRRYDLLLVSTNVHPDEGALLVVVIAEGRIRGYYPLTANHLENFLRRHAADEYDSLLHETAGDEAALRPRLEVLYEQFRMRYPHDAGALHEPRLDPSDRVILLPVEHAVPDRRALRDAGAFQED